MHKLYLLVSIILIAGCSLSGDDEIVVSAVHPELRVDLANPLELDSDFALRLTTTDDACSTSELLAEGLIQGRKIRVEVSGLVVPSTCSTEKLPVEKDIAVGLQSGSYTLAISIGEELASFGHLYFDGEEYSLSIEDPHGLVIGHDKLRKIPEQIVWGEVSSETNIEEIIAEFNTVTENLTAPIDLESGYYGYFSVEDGSGINLIANSLETTGYSYPFLFRLKSNTNDFRNALDNFRDQYPDQLKITCTTWTGEEL